MEKEFVVTVKEGANWEELHNELNRDTTLDDSVDSNIVPDRTVDTVKLRSNNKRNTHYNLTPEEAVKLAQDPRVIAVELPLEDRGIDKKPFASVTRSGTFSKVSAQHLNLPWAFLQCAGTPGGHVERVCQEGRDTCHEGPGGGNTG